MALMDEMKNQINDENEKVGFVKAYIPTKGDSLKEVIRKLSFFLAILVLIFALWQLFIYFFGNPLEDDLNDYLLSLKESYTASSEQEGTDTDVNDTGDSLTDPTNPQVEVPSILPQYKEILLLNSDLVGWLDIDGTQMSYPVLQTNDNKYYLKHNFKKEESKAGAVFADYKIKLTATENPDNTILYGHNMASGEIFAYLSQYRFIDFFKEHQVITFDTLYEEGKWKVFGCFLTGAEPEMDDGNFFPYHYANEFNSQEEFDEFYNEVMKRNYYETDVDVVFGDKLLSIQTCLNSEYQEARFVVVARKVRDGEDAYVDTSKTVENEDKYMTKEWYEAHG